MGPTVNSWPGFSLQPALTAFSLQQLDVKTCSRQAVTDLAAIFQQPLMGGTEFHPEAASEHQRQDEDGAESASNTGGVITRLELSSQPN